MEREKKEVTITEFVKPFSQVYTDFEFSSLKCQLIFLF